MSHERLVLLWGVAAGCSRSFLEEELDGTRHVWTRLTSNGNGSAHVKLGVDAGESAMLATARVDPPLQVHFRSLKGPFGEEVFQAFEWNQSPYSKTNAGFVADVVSLNWPVGDEDSSLSPGRWEFEFGVVDETQQYTSAPVFLDVLLKPDETFQSGELRVSIVYTEGLDRDQGLRAAVDEANDIWRDLYGSMGIDIVFNDYAFPDDDLLPPAFGEEQAYIDIAADTAPRSVNLVISEQIQGDGLDDIFGIAGDIPGPLIPTTRSAVQISALLAAGPDGAFNAEDTRLLAETMAHEVAHYLGLFHPVESTWDAWDVLSDTSECDSEGDCVETLGDNLMFPFPVCGPATCTPQDRLTGQQAGVANRYVGVW